MLQQALLQRHQQHISKDAVSKVCWADIVDQNNESSPLEATCTLKGRSITPLANIGELSGLKIQAEA